MSTDSPIWGRFASERKRLGLSQADLAAACGIGKEMISRYERGVATPGGEVLAAFGRLGADIYWILVGRRQNEPQQVLLSADEIRLVDDYRSLTDEMRAKVLGYLQAAVELDLRRGTSRTLRRPEATKKKPAKKK